MQLDKALAAAALHERGQARAEEAAAAAAAEEEEQSKQHADELLRLRRSLEEQALLDKTKGVLPALQNKIRSLEEVVSHLNTRLRKTPSMEVKWLLLSRLPAAVLVWRGRTAVGLLPPPPHSLAHRAPPRGTGRR